MRPTNIEDALKLKARATRKRALAGELADSDSIDARLARLEADECDDAADAYLDPAAHSPGPLAVGRGGEIGPIGTEMHDLPGLVDTVRASPDYVTAKASSTRLDLAATAGALDLATDTAETIGARNSVEKMLAHQMAAAHRSAMELFGLGRNTIMRSGQNGSLPNQTASVEGARMLNTAARLMQAYQSGMLALQRLRSGGTQRVIVQHVTVRDGGQAVVAGSLDPAAKRRRNRGA